MYFSGISANLDENRYESALKNKQSTGHQI